VFHIHVRRLWIFVGLIALAGCAPAAVENAEPPVGQDGWLAGSTAEKLDVVAGQLRGFDMAMVETGYRFNELYFAGEDRNWDFAKYHAEKIGTAIRNGLQRRPKRAASAETFLNIVLPETLGAIEKKDIELFRQRFNTMLSTCNTCHRDEMVAFISVVQPKQRLTPTAAPSE
jgi:hypothetical protein